MVYRRVIPRDLFNEANLLKCLGQLYIKLESIGCCRAGFEVEDVQFFEIVQSAADGSISVHNLPFSINSKLWRLSRPLNSRQPWPLYADDGENVVAVFDDDGTLSTEMIRLLNGKRA